MDNYFGFGKKGHNVRDCQNVKVKDKDSGKASGLNDAPKKNNFYALPSRGEKETSPDVVTGMLKVFSIDVYALLYLGATLSFVTPLISKKFGVLPNILNKPFMLNNQVGKPIVAKIV